MLMGSGRHSATASMLSLSAALSCGQTSHSERYPPNVTVAYAGRAASEAAGDGNAGSVGGARGVVGGAGGHSGTAAGTAGASGKSSKETQQPGIVIVDGPSHRIEVVGDREGNALVMWDDFKGQFSFARWVAAERAWHHPAPLMLSNANIEDTYSSGHPILIDDEVNPQTGEISTFVRRFDPQTNEWRPAQPADFEGTFAYRFYVSMDGAGNVYLLHNRTYQNWTWWPVAADTWRPLRTVQHANGIVGARQAGAWLWQEQSGFGARAFDLDAGDWGDEYEFESLEARPIDDFNWLTVGPSGEALAAVFHQEQSQLTTYVWRYDPTLAAWQPRETALQAATVNGSKTPYAGPLPITDFLHMDVVAAMVPTGDQFALQTNRRDPSTGIWSPLHEFAGVTDSNPDAFVADDSGNLYGCVPPAGLFHYDSDSQVWTNPNIDVGCNFVVFDKGAFAVGTTTNRELTAYFHPGGDGAWRIARGLPTGISPQIGLVPYAAAPLDTGHAIVVWQIQSGIRAAFIE